VRAERCTGTDYANDEIRMTNECSNARSPNSCFVLLSSFLLRHFALLSFLPLPPGEGSGVRTARVRNGLIGPLGSPFAHGRGSLAEPSEGNRRRLVIGVAPRRAQD
jgi:hypothetical protein